MAAETPDEAKWRRWRAVATSLRLPSTTPLRSFCDISEFRFSEFSTVSGLSDTVALANVRFAHRMLTRTPVLQSIPTFWILNNFVFPTYPSIC
jgi:hypothetical protein